jgi:UDP-N-acetylglucosamine 2-epimerase
VKVASIVGARPQFIKASPLIAALHGHQSVLIHTGQHYDRNMSAVFFDELGIPSPDYHLGIGSGSHGAQTGAMLAAVEQVLTTIAPDWVVVFGDTNSTLAGALAAAKLGLPVAHVEAGLRSFNRAMPEEINRVVTDHVSELLFCPSETAAANLRAEGISRGIEIVGDVMYEAVTRAAERARRASTVLARLALEDRPYLLLTLHRAENADDPNRLMAIVDAVSALHEPIVFPVHPRTAARLKALGIALPPHVRPIEPLGYLDMVRALEGARRLLTDSGGLQKEAYWLGVPCVTLRDETEWVETVEAGWNVLAGADRGRIEAAVVSWSRPASRAPLYGDGLAASRIVTALCTAGRTHGSAPIPPGAREPMIGNRSPA